MRQRSSVPLVFALAAVAACSDAPTGGSAAPIAAGFLPPIEGSPRTSNVFDHALPFQFADDNGYLLAWWGERVAGIDGHSGYDFVVPEGTPVRAVTDGIVLYAGSEEPFYCPLLQRTVAGLMVRVGHRLASGSYQTTSLHLSEIDVFTGQSVAAGQSLGRSGNTGCSTGPHLHFGVRRLTSTGGPGPAVDPYGWQGADRDPWADHPSGTTSVPLWRDGAAPPLYSEVVSPALPGTGAGIVRVRWMGVRDASTPSNEFIDVEKRSGTASIALDGWTLRTLGASAWTFPAGTVLDAARPRVRVYVGQAQDAASLGMGRTAGIIGNQGDCVVLQSPDGSRYTVLIRTGSCPIPSAGALRRTIVDAGDAGDARASMQSSVIATP